MSSSLAWLFQPGRPRPHQSGRVAAGRARGAAPAGATYSPNTALRRVRFSGVAHSWHIRGRAVRSKRPMTDAQAAPQQQSALGTFSDELASVVERAARSIVTVAARPRQSASGILWRAETEPVGLTADHVIEREDDINVTLPDGRKVKAQLVGRDPGTDLAVLRLPGTDLGTANVAAETAEGAKVGHLVLAIGLPAGGGPRVSVGAIGTIEGPHRSWHGRALETLLFAYVTP